MTSQAGFRFYGELNDFLPPGRKDILFSCLFEGSPSVKHLIEASGVPHTEVQLILVNGEQVGFDYHVQDSDRISVYPWSSPRRSDENPISKGLPATDPRFILDNHLGKLAHYLRMLGFDCLYRNDYQDDELAQTACAEGRTLLTRDRQLLMRSIITSGYCIRELVPRRQVEEVLRRFDLFTAVRPFQRCIRCNGLLQPVEKEAVIHRLEPLTRSYYNEFRICPNCSQIYWKGSHYERMLKFIERVIIEER